MALLLRHPDGSYASACAICGQPLTNPIFATSHFIGDEHHDLWRYSDAAMHWDCYARWPHQTRFADLHFQSWVRVASSEPSQSYWPTLFQTDDVLVRYGVAVHEVSIELRKSGSGLRVLREDWPSWVAARWTEWSRHELEHDALVSVLPDLKRLELPEIPP